MNAKQNLHTHSSFCDGKNFPEELVLEAIAKGFGSIGFSSHSYTYFEPRDCLTPENTEDYKSTIYSLKEKYKGKIDIFCGLEADLFSDIDFSGYEYLIGSLHYLKVGDKIIGFDGKKDRMKQVIDEYFCGSGISFAKEYFKQFSTLANRQKYDIIGHFDIVAKHRDNASFFDENSKEYQDAALETLESLSGKIPFFEVNTGVIARGYRNAPYPSVYLLKELNRLGFGAVISSDCHKKQFLDHSFDLSEELLLSTGFKERYILTESGFKGVKLK